MAHTLSLVMKGKSLSLQWYDHEGIITTRPVDFGTDQGLEIYLSLLYILQRFDTIDWGIHPGFPPPPFHRSHDSHLNDPVVTIGNKRFRPTFKTRHKQWGIKGRATSAVDCVELDEHGIPGRDCVIKLSFPQELRVREHKFIDRALEIAKVNPHTLHHIPEYVAYEEYPETSTGHIRRALGIETTNHRQMYAIVLIQLKAPIYKLSGVDYWRAWWDCFQCHRVLWTNGLYH